jgi:thioredoxin 1
MTALNIVKLNASNFPGQVLQSPTPVVVDFWAEWCGPCKMIAPVLDELAGEYDQRVRIGKVNVDEDQKLAVDYNIQSIPTLLLFKGGQVVGQIVGMKSKRDLKAEIDKLIA